MAGRKEVLVHKLIHLIAMLGVIFSLGCRANPIAANEPFEPISHSDATPVSGTLPDSSSEEIATPDRIEDARTKLPERIPPTKKTTPITGETPKGLLDSIVKDLAERTGATFENITVIQDQAIVWNDGSLGCAQPGEFYTQVTVNGYWVILEIDGKQYDYRATDRGYYILCDGRLHPYPPTGTPSS
jgi:hypothetical protein